MSAVWRKGGFLLAIGGAAALWAYVSFAIPGTPRRSALVRVDGSSTVFPIVVTAAELFVYERPEVDVSVGESGTGGGFKKFLEAQPTLRIDICNASRPVKKEELARAGELGVEFIELPVAYDGIAVCVNPANNFCEHLTVDELKRIWDVGSTINNWKDVRPGFPDLPLRLFGPGADSGTFDYFTEVVCGKEDRCRPDFTPSEDDNVLVTGIAGDRGALGYFGFAYYESNQARLKLLAIAHGDKPPQLPSVDHIRRRIYTPLSRPLMIYVNRAAAQRDEVRVFLNYLLENGERIVEHPSVNYVALSDPLYAAVRRRLASETIGTLFTAPDASRKSLYELLGVPVE